VGQRQRRAQSAMDVGVMGRDERWSQCLDEIPIRAAGLGISQVPTPTPTPIRSRLVVFSDLDAGSAPSTMGTVLLGSHRDATSSAVKEDVIDAFDFTHQPASETRRHQHHEDPDVQTDVGDPSRGMARTLPSSQGARVRCALSPSLGQG
jgi:hypothetical protein